jgi:hypothetical protein
MQSVSQLPATRWLDEQFAASSGPFALTNFGQKRYLGYPHTNPFSQHGRILVMAARNEKSSSLWRIDLDSGDERKICEFSPAAKMGYFDVARQAGVLVVVADNALWLYNIEDCSLVCEHRRDGLAIDGLPAITADARQAVAGFVRDGRYGGYRLDTAASSGEILCEFDWYANHFHFSPHDSHWIAFSHEGRCDQIPDRVWAWHSALAPAGRNIFDQRSTGRFIQVGHERWCFHDTSALVVAFGSNPDSERGIYETYVDSRPSRLLSAGDNDWHVNISYDGRWAVVDTVGPYNTLEWKERPAPGAPWPWGLQSDIVVIDMKTGSRQLAAHSRIGGGHPAHPHPAFSPDGRWIFYNEVDSVPPENRIMCAPNPLFV